MRLAPPCQLLLLPQRRLPSRHRNSTPKPPRRSSPAAWPIPPPSGRAMRLSWSTAAGIWSRPSAWTATARAFSIFRWPRPKPRPPGASRPRKCWKNSRGTPGFAERPHVVIVPGGVPVFSADGKTRIGAVGVSGEAPADDAACAEAGISSGRASRNRPCLLDPPSRRGGRGAACRKSIPMPRRRSTGCCSTA